MNNPANHAILVVEDEPLILFDAVDMLEYEGFRTYQAKNADVALAILEEHSDIALILTDIDMPGSINGLALAQTVCSRWPRIAIVIVSGRVHPTTAELPKNSRFISKPYVNAAILRAMHETMPA